LTGISAELVDLIGRCFNESGELMFFAPLENGPDDVFVGATAGEYAGMVAGFVVGDDFH
jgi:hypothetical protein